MLSCTAHPLRADFHTRCVTGGPSVQVLVCWCFTGHIKGQNKPPGENPADGVVHLGSTGTIWIYLRDLSQMALAAKEQGKQCNSKGNR